ncbi:MAG: glycoside hydrolase family 31 protein [Deltaproteobacteria bacterium]|nr:glycoside hydrolase family 31 protein [Deltaproteobacteria bacterium]
MRMLTRLIPLLLVATLLPACKPQGGEADGGVDAGPPPIHTPRWAFEPWISKDISDGPDTYAFVEGFQSRDIPVGTVVLDSPWETNYNTFIPNPERYPDFGQMVADLRERGVRVVLWTTQMVNEVSFDLEAGGDQYDGPAENFYEGLDEGYYVEEGATSFWWKGEGAGVDFFDPDASAWWRAQQNPLLDLGVAGWKLDFGENYLGADPLTTAAGEQSLQAYSEKYYEDFWVHGATRRGTEEFVTMVRPWDASYNFEGRFFARPEHAPICWVGDNRRDWIGLIDALDHIFRSVEAGYVVVGSDIGGYLDRDDVELTETIPFDETVFARWTAVGAMTPFMQLHGRANITPWTTPDDPARTVEIYRYWSKLHSYLVPFFYSLAQEAYAGGPHLMDPVGSTPAEWEGDWRFRVGEAFLVAPILDATGVRDVALPAGRWLDWWALDGAPLEGGETLAAYDATATERLPLFLAEGAVVPMVVRDAALGFGSAASAGRDFVLAWPGSAATTFRRHDEDGEVTTLSASSGRLELSRRPRAVELRLRTGAITGASAGGALTRVADRAALESTASSWRQEGEWIEVRLPAGGPVTLTWQ